MRLGLRRRVCSCTPSLLILGLAACGTGAYVKPVAQFGTAAADVTSSRETMNAGYRADRERMAMVVAIQGGGVWSLTRGCYKPERIASDGCEVFAQMPPEQPRPGAPTLASLSTPATATAVDFAEAVEAGDAPLVCVRESRDAGKLLRVTAPAAAKAAVTPEGTQDPLTEEKLFSIVAAYAEALRAITDASDREEFDAAADKLAGSAGALAGTLGALAGGIGAGIAPVVSGAVKLGAFATVRAREVRRFEALQAAMRNTCLPMRVLSIAAGGLLAATREERFGLNQQILGITIRPSFPRGVSQPAMRGLAVEAASAMTSMRVDPMVVAQKMRQAHDELATAVLEGHGQGAVLAASLTEFGKLAGEMASALRATRQPAANTAQATPPTAAGGGV